MGKSGKSFQSTLPVGGATRTTTRSISGTRSFNPRSPWGERLVGGLKKRYAEKFQSTLPVGGATTHLDALSISFDVSIHAPRGGSDPVFSFIYMVFICFNPRSPWGERPGYLGSRGGEGDVSIHAPRGGSDQAARLPARRRFCFNPRSPWGERQQSRPLEVSLPRGKWEDSSFFPAIFVVFRVSMILPRKKHFCHFFPSLISSGFRAFLKITDFCSLRVRTGAK